MSDRGRIRFEVPADAGGRRLDLVVRDGLADRLGVPVSRADARRLVERGGVRVDGRPVRRSSRPVVPGAVLEVDVVREELTERADRRRGRVILHPEAILFEDEALIAVDKPPGLPSDRTRDGRRDHLRAAVERLLRSRDGEPPAWLRLVHRLDAETSGVVLLSKDPLAHRVMSRSFREREVEKVYQAVVTVRREPPAEEWIVAAPLAWDRRRRRMRAVRAGGDPARTAFRLLERRGDLARVEARPRTGRTHQIRVHLAESHLPILGDRLYGPRDRGPDRGGLRLHAERIELRHPTTGAALRVDSPPPPSLRLTPR